MNDLLSSEGGTTAPTQNVVAPAKPALEPNIEQRQFLRHVSVRGS